VEFRDVDLNAHRDILVDLIDEYLSQVLGQIKDLYGVEIPPPGNLTLREYAEASVDDLVPPRGFCYLMEEDGAIVGMGAIRETRKGVGEIKRMYVRPEYRRRGIGRALLNKLLDKGMELGFTKVVLDTGRFMTVAQSLYRSAGFVEREAYAESEVPSEFRRFWVFMEKDL
jgi:ribosomal protein S18 acetylase RimI-like enzyme